ncbi:MAG: hypothetical protein IH859_00435 [Chloroflexi bacterium]|nr:hypothetical protein [Chloroflexota bacterium]
MNKRTDFQMITSIVGTPQEEALTSQELEQVHEFREAYFKAPHGELTDQEAASLTAILDKVGDYKHEYRTAGSSFKSIEDKRVFTDLFHDLCNYLDEDFPISEDKAQKFKGKNLKPIRIVIDVPVPTAILMLLTDFYSDPDCNVDAWRHTLDVFFSDRRGNYPKRLKPLIYRLLNNDMHDDLHHLCVTDWLTPEGRARRIAEINSKK